MTSIRRFCCDDLLRFASLSLDDPTGLYETSFYMKFLAMKPDYFRVAEGPGKRIMGYIMGRVNKKGEPWHGHVSNLTVAPEYRRLKVAKRLMNLLEDLIDKIDKVYFLNLFVRGSNTPAIKLYEKLGFVRCGQVLRYYSFPCEDAFDMRKALSRDINKKSIIPLHLNCPITPNELEDSLRRLHSRIQSDVVGGLI